MGGIASLLKKDLITIEQESLTAEGELAGQESGRTLPSPGEMNLLFLFQLLQMGFKGTRDLLWFKAFWRRTTLWLLATPPWCFTQDCLVLSVLRACRKCSSMKTGNLQCCNLMAHAASKQQVFYWPPCSLVYRTELPGQVTTNQCDVFPQDWDWF